ncbi:MAG: CBS domain-containing protein [Candidatus Firestonebacteria bacterium]
MKIITSHINADFDALASMVAAGKIYPDAKMVFPGSCEKKVQEFLLLYHEHFKVFKLKDINLEEITELIIVDTKSAKRIGEIGKILNKEGLKICVYDHHPPGEDDIKGEILGKDLHLGATITLFLKYFKENDISINTVEGTLFAIALYEETGFFSFASVTPLEFEMMAFLIKFGVNVNIVKDFLKEGFTLEQDLLFRKLLSSIKTYEINNFPIRIAEAEVSYFVKDIALVVHKLRDMGNLNCLFAMVKLPNRIHIIARSNIEEVNVGEVLKEFGGGGHKVAAAATLKGSDLVSAKENLLKVLKEKVRPFLKASDIMSKPVLTIKSNITCEEARKIMLRFNHSSLPVAVGNELKGIVSITDLDKAIQHNFNNAEVSGYMKTNVKTVTPETPFLDIQRLMIEENIGKIPVVDENLQIKGIITRTDVLKNINKEIFKEKIIQIEKELEKVHPEIINVKDILMKRLPLKLYNLLIEICKVAEKNNVKAYVVGGFVRDLLLNIENFDVDIAIEGNGIGFANLLAKRFKASVKKYKKFGTAVVHFKEGFKIDIATSRVEFYEYPASAPQVEFSLIKYDLFRRDFTVNTMAIKLNLKDFGTLIDFFGGQRDLQNKLIRSLHNMSFIEDPTRIFRAIRFEQRYGFKIENSTQNYLKNALELEMFDKLATRKIKDEMVLILGEDLPLKAINRMKELNVLKYIHPNLKISNETKHLFKEVTNSFVVEVLFLEEKTDRWIVNFLSLVDCLNIEEIKEVCERFKFDKNILHKIILIRENEKKVISCLNRAKFKNSLIYKEVFNVPVEGLLFYLAKSKSLRVRQRLHLYISTLKKTKVELSGDDLKNIGLKPGPIYKEIFREILYNKLDGNIKTKDDEISYVKKIYQL